MEFTYQPKGVCSTQIRFRLDGDVVRDICFTGGCNGNLKAIAKLCEGMRAEEIEQTLAGNTCGARDTSCADQFARALRAARDARVAS